MNKNIQRILRVLRTSRFLKPSQLYWFVRRRFVKTRAKEPVVPQHVSHREWAWPCAEPPAADSQAIATVKFSFLNVSRSYPLAAIQWAPQDVNRLWRYNLHYFDYLLDEQRSSNEKAYLISDWIAKNPLGSEPAWEPYTASLRIVNWVKYLSSSSAEARSCKNALNSLYQQTLWLEQNLELHILANHYFENLKALLFAGVFFQGDDANRWKNYAVAELAKQLKEQILPDGCHYERTPQYHAVILDDVLDMLQMVRLQPTLFAEEFVAQLSETAKRMAIFLADILNPLGQYPLFNDSAFYDVAPLDILRRAEALGLPVAASSRADEIDESPADARFYAVSPRIIQHHAAGIYGYVAADDWIFMDCGDIGPSYQPGHTHCDMLSYELGIGGIPLVVDTGVLEYEPGAMRHYVRSTAAHNAVQVDAAEQSEIWGEFRVARRARKLQAGISRKPEGIVFDGSFTGFHQLGGIAHRRTLEIGIDYKGRPHSWHIIDLVRGSGNHRLRSYIHLHPDITPYWQGEILSLDYHGKSLACLIVSPADPAAVTVAIEESRYFPEFGLAQDNKCIVLEMHAGLPARFGYTIKRSE